MTSNLFTLGINSFRIIDRPGKHLTLQKVAMPSGTKKDKKEVRKDEVRTVLTVLLDPLFLDLVDGSRMFSHAGHAACQIISHCDCFTPGWKGKCRSDEAGYVSLVSLVSLAVQHTASLSSIHHRWRQRKTSKVTSLLTSLTPLTLEFGRYWDNEIQIDCQ